MSGPFGRARADSGRSARFAAAEDSDEQAKRIQVPISHPRYERKTRLSRSMAVTDSTGDDTGRSPAELMSMRSREALHVRQGPVSHQEKITYRAFACYKHGARQVHTQSVGYSSDGDLVLVRRDIAEASDGASCNSYRRSAQMVESAVCLNPKARPQDPVVEGDVSGPEWERRLARIRKYPGVRCPKNRKIRNRLVNDHFATPAARALYEAAEEDSDPDGLKDPASPVFAAIPETLSWLVHTDEAVQQAELDKLGFDIDRFGAIGGGRKPSKQAQRPIDGADFRFSQLQTRMRGELQHAMSTDYMPGFMQDLEDRIAQLIGADEMNPGQAPASIEVECRDGYGRLVTHGVAAFYKLQSQSTTTADGRRVTTVSLPKRRVPLPDQRLTSFLRGERSPTAAGQPARAPPINEPGDVSDSEDDGHRVQLRRKRFKKRMMRRRPDDLTAPPKLGARGTSAYVAAR